MRNPRNQRGALDKRHWSEWNFENVNKVRKKMGLRQIVVKERSCLRCEKGFTSQGEFNRLCETCSKTNPSFFDWGVKLNAKGG